jgi:RNA polymerase sigma-70 factor (sigma-E family)
VEVLAGPDDVDWAEVAATLAPALLRLALMLTGDRHDAEDLLQATYAKVGRHGPRIARMAAPAAYLRTAMVREHATLHRRRRLRTVPLEAAAAVATPPDSAELRDEVWRWLATLPRQQRAVLVLRFYEDLPDDEIAAIIGCGAVTVRSHAARGLAALRTLVSQHQEES